MRRRAEAPVPSGSHRSDEGEVSGAIPCPRCGLVLAVREPGRGVVMRHRGRVALNPEVIYCDRRGCGGEWRAEKTPRPVRIHVG